MDRQILFGESVRTISFAQRHLYNYLGQLIYGLIRPEPKTDTRYSIHCIHPNYASVVLPERIRSHLTEEGNDQALALDTGEPALDGYGGTDPVSFHMQVNGKDAAIAIPYFSTREHSQVGQLKLVRRSDLAFVEIGVDSPIHSRSDFGAEMVLTIAVVMSV